MRPTFLAGTAAVAVLALTVASCASDSESSPGDDGAAADAPTLTVGGDSISTFDYSMTNAGYQLIGGLVLEPLLVLDEDGELIPWLAESWEQTDDTTYVYHLREGVEFTSGNELTAEDVAFTYDYYRADGSANAYNFPDALESVEATDTHTVTVTLNRPDSAWRVVPAGGPMGIFEKAHFDENTDTFGQPGTGVVGTGPWQLDTFNPTTGASLSANANYWGPEQPFGDIEMTFYASETNSALAFRAGEVDLVIPSDSDAFASAANTELLRVPGVNRTGMFRMNTLQEPWDDVHVRRAVAHALDKEALILAGGVYATPLDTFIPPELLQTIATPEDIEAALQDVPTYEHDIDLALAEMAKSDYPDGAQATLMTIGDGAPSKISQALVEQLRPLGIDLTIEVMTPEASTAMKLGADRDAIYSGFDTYGGIGLDPGRAFDYAIGSRHNTEGGWNTAAYEPEEVDDLIEAGFATSDDAERLDIYAEMLQHFGDDVPFVPVYLTDMSVALSDDVEWAGFSAYWRLAGPWALQLSPAGT